MRRDDLLDAILELDKLATELQKSQDWPMHSRIEKVRTKLLSHLSDVVNFSARMRALSDEGFN